MYGNAHLVYAVRSGNSASLVECSLHISGATGGGEASPGGETSSVNGELHIILRSTGLHGEGSNEAVVCPYSHTC